MKTMTNIAAASVCSLALSIAHAATITIDNSSFENDWTDWTDSDPSAISSSDAYSGSKSAKLSGSGGGFSQTVSVSANTDYVLSAWILGSGAIGATAGSNSTTSNVTDASSWQEATVTFNSGSNSSVTIFGSYYDDEGRFDLFSLESDDDTSSGSCTDNDSLSISTATDDGTNDGHGPLLAIDNSLSDESRWSSNGAPKAITFDLGEVEEVTGIEVAFYKGDQRSAYFYVETSSDGSSWTSVLENATSSGSTTGYETFDLDDSDARYVRFTGNGNSANSWNSILEVNILGCGDTDTGTGTGTGNDYDLDPDGAPSDNFELVDWYLSIPTNEAGDDTEEIKEAALSSGYEHDDFFYTASDGGMVFVAPIEGYTTSSGTSYTRTELREMLRRGDTSISTSGVNKNNWVFSSTSSTAQNAAGGVDGTLSATLAVNHVTTTGDDSHVGRVIIGQIHANSDEPARLYYRKLPGNTNGSIYLAHEPTDDSGRDEEWYDMIGSRDDDASDPSDGIALDEVFSYEIKVVGHDLWVTIFREGKSDVVQHVDMTNSGFDEDDRYQYFKAGVYNQNSSGDGDDYVQATFYKLENSHDGYDY